MQADARGESHLELPQRLHLNRRIAEARAILKTLEPNPE